MEEGQVTFGVLGPVTAWSAAGSELVLKGPRHRAVLARLIVARRRVVPIERLVSDLWQEPGPGAASAVQTFVGVLRRALEPDRPPRAPARLLVSQGTGYALRAAPDAVDAWRFESAIEAAAALPNPQAIERLDEALDLWRGPAYAAFAEEPWARGECKRLEELRLRAVEQRAECLLALGHAAQAIPDLEAHVADQPWRENAWRLLALALYRAGRQGDALSVLRKAKRTLRDELGVDPSPSAGLRRLEHDILTQAPRLDPETATASTSDGLHRATEAFERAVAPGARARLESTVGMLRNLALTGGTGLEAAREQRLEAIAAAESYGRDPELTARVIGAYDVPAIWPRSDDPDQAAYVVAAAERTLQALPEPPAADAARCRLLATIALEMRGTRNPRGPQAAQQADALSLNLGDPALRAFALNGLFMQSCTSTGLSKRRDEIGTELLDLATRHGLENHEILGHLIRLQARAAQADFPTADAHADAVDRLARQHERPLVNVFTTWYRALRTSATSQNTTHTETAYQAAAALLDGAGMPGLQAGLLPLARLSVHLSPTQAAITTAIQTLDPTADWGPYCPWVEPLLLIRANRTNDAANALRKTPKPPADLMCEAMYVLVAAAALQLADRTTIRRVHEALLPAADELAGAGSGLISLGPTQHWLNALSAAL
jgi:DNA-binding SARP family transcriptional activator